MNYRSITLAVAVGCAGMLGSARGACGPACGEGCGEVCSTAPVCGKSYAGQVYRGCEAACHDGFRITPCVGGGCCPAQPSCGVEPSCGCESAACCSGPVRRPCGEGFVRALGRLARCLCGPTCAGCDGELYWSEWHNDPPQCCDPCDHHGQWTGPTAGLPARPRPRRTDVATRPMPRPADPPAAQQPEIQAEIEGPRLLR